MSNGAQPSPRSWGCEKGKEVVHKGRKSWSSEHMGGVTKRERWPRVAHPPLLLGDSSSDGDSLPLCLWSWHLAQPSGAVEDELAASSAGGDEAVRARSRAWWFTDTR